MSKSTVVISHAPVIDFRQNFAALPRNYGTPAYFKRPDVQAIYRLVRENLTQLDEKTLFTKEILDRKVILKPNLVTVYSQMGLVERDYPETTDPRVIDAVIAFLKQFTRNITIAESSGRGVPTRGSFRVAGLDRLARYHNIQLVALEEQPTIRYILPKAKVQKEIIVPAIFEDVIEGRAFYISMPKLKTNLYTGVTLGFKNAMGTLPYNLRQRNHHFDLDQKLVDMLYLFKPDLTIIDGLVGGEGNCPAPVDPVDSRVIISGNNSVETDRVATRMMGFDPSQITLMVRADAAGFNDPAVEIIGAEKVTPFQPADPSMTNESFRKLFPNVKVLVGHQFPHQSPQGAANPSGQPTAGHVEMQCRGGCQATTRFAFDMFIREGLRRDFQLVLILGSGIRMNGKTIYLDGHNTAFDLEQIQKLPGKKMAVGTCAKELAGVVDRFVDGCMPYPNSPHVALHQLTGTLCRVLTPKNRHLLPMLFATLQMCETRKKLYRQGLRTDCNLPGSYHLVETRPLTAAEEKLDFIRWELPSLSAREIRQACARENHAILATFLG
jgi:uncharacterized protein (DUF362 family)